MAMQNATSALARGRLSRPVIQAASAASMGKLLDRRCALGAVVIARRQQQRLVFAILSIVHKNGNAGRN